MAGGVLVAFSVVVISAARQAPPSASGEFIRRAPDEAGAANVVNAIIVDFRALDTLGEITVLLIAAAVTASLVLATRHDQRRRGRFESGSGVPEHEKVLGRVPPTGSPRSRSAGGNGPISMTGTGRVNRGCSPATVRIPPSGPCCWRPPPGSCSPRCWCFRCTCCWPGTTSPAADFRRVGSGLAFVLRYIAGGRQDIGAVVRVRPPVLVGAGLTLAVLTALAPALFGAPVLSTAIFEMDFPVLGHLELVTSLFLDLGVYLLIVGVVLDLLRSLGHDEVQDDVEDRRVARREPPAGSMGTEPGTDEAEGEEVLSAR
ncbi:MAG: hydrogen gas-evolving membrane-bound hydrogenase subunit E [Pseudonocardiaceae bacterium]